MKTATINVNVYEIGDVIELNGDNLKLVAKQRAYSESRRALIVGVNQRIDKMFTYKILAENGKVISFSPNEQGNEKYVGHIELGLLYGDAP